MSTIDLFLATFNCGRRLQDAATIQNIVSHAVSKSADEDSNKVIVAAFQEFAPIEDASFGKIGPFLDPIVHGIESAIGGDYLRADVVVLGAIVIAVYVHSSVQIVHTLSATIGTGMINSSLKGAAGVRIMLEQESTRSEFTFVSAHLAAQEGNADARNRDFYSIATKLDFGDGFGLYKPESHTFFLGDLNYRTKENPVTSGEDSWSHQSKKYDELITEMKNMRVLYGFTEAPIEFMPSYKYAVGTYIYDTKRNPSWCDRILWLEYPADTISIHAYESLRDVVTSDHKPVYLSIRVPFNPPPSVVTESGYLTLEDQFLYLGLDPQRDWHKSTTVLADGAIGWGSYLILSRTGNMYLLVALVAFYLLRKII
ncbi:phosphatidylinositol 4,5-bisphosphate 5-phosphatase Inp54p [Trichomonascus vanleenenianus]|uniref:phosphoinositide 5-phosphatase INP54 n=1 Tax=Trichomonascus vanleenenianus TaxID=2268995 RepID=UPI003EC9EAEA